MQPPFRQVQRARTPPLSLPCSSSLSRSSSHFPDPSPAPLLLSDHIQQLAEGPKTKHSTLGGASPAQSTEEQAACSQAAPSHTRFRVSSNPTLPSVPFLSLSRVSAFFYRVFKALCSCCSGSKMCKQLSARTFSGQGAEGQRVSPPPSGCSHPAGPRAGTGAGALLRARIPWGLLAVRARDSLRISDTM